MSAPLRRQLNNTIQAERLSLEQAYEVMRQDYAGDEHNLRLLEEAYEAELAQRQEHVQLTGAVINRNSYPTRWVAREHEAGHWARYRQRLAASQHPGLSELEESTRFITSLLAAPGPHGGKRKGLVMGNVQSGKTANFAGVIARAVDGGYGMVIVLAGIYNNLREQTQVRLDRDVFNPSDGWFGLSNRESDVTYHSDFPTMVRNGTPIAPVVKKNITRLERLVRMLRNLPTATRANLPILIIDDEADQATPNSERHRNAVSGINGQLRELWELVENGTYLAYTATPFANVLTDPDDANDLFPSDFITTLEPGSGYFGPERIFGLADATEDDLASDGLDMVRKIPDSDVQSFPSNASARRSFVPEVTPSLRDAVTWFVVATAIRRARGQVAHSSMLVHITHYTDPHFALADGLRDLLDEFSRAVAEDDDDAFHRAWSAEHDRVREVRTTPDPSWPRVREFLPQVLSEVKVIVDNGASDDRLDYGDEEPETVIAVGGGTLARGLTLEGLVVSYFSRTSAAYDTLLQMGRWFGYRAGYEDLARIWVSKDLDRDYAFLARVEKDLRDEIRSVQDSEHTPHQVGVKVRHHPGRLQITAANKMFAADQVQVGLGLTERQTILLDGRPEVARDNLGAVEVLIAGQESRPAPRHPTRRIYPDVPTEDVISFLDAYRHDPGQTYLADPDEQTMIRKWLRTFARDTPWNVVLLSNTRSAFADGTPLGQVTVGGHVLNNFNRAPLKDKTVGTHIDIKGLSSAGDKTSDLEDAGDAPAHAWRQVRRHRAPGQGLLLIYPISPSSRPERVNEEGLSSRTDMPDAVTEPLIGFSIVFPESEQGEQGDGNFVSVRRYWEIAEPEDDSPLGEDEDNAR